MSNVFRLHHTQITAEPVSDAALLTACGGGDMAALGELFYRFQADVYGFLSRLAGTDEAELDDLVQNTFLQVQKSARRFEHRSSVKSWIFAVAANVARHYVRSSVRRKAAFRSLGERLAVTAENPTVYDSVEKKVIMDELMTALGELSYKLRVVFVMCDVEGISGVEAARTLGIREGTLWRRLHDARKKLAARIERRASK